MLEVKNTLTEIKNDFDGLINRWDMAKERISVLKDMTVNISKTEKQRENKQTNKTDYSRSVRQLQKRHPLLFNPSQFGVSGNNYCWPSGCTDHRITA